MSRHMLGDDDDEDVYASFNDYNASVETDEIVNDSAFQQAVKTSHGRRPPTTTRGGGQMQKAPPSQMGGTFPGAAGGGQDAGNRPMTSMRAAGFTAHGRPGGATLPADSPLAGAPLKKEQSADDKSKAMERQVLKLVEESMLAGHKGNFSEALQLAKEAGKKERFLNRQRDMNNEQPNLDVTYAMLLNLALQYEANEMYTEAINSYQAIIKNRMYSHGGRLKLNMGNIYFKQKAYSKAVKYYRMAYDQVPTPYKSMRIRIMRNIGTVFVKLGQYHDAITSYEHIMQEQPTFPIGFNLILCYFAMGERDKIRRAFSKMLTVDVGVEDDSEDKYVAHPDDKQHNFLVEATRNDSLRKWERARKAEAERFIKQAAKIICRAIERTFDMGYDWCIEQVKNSPYAELANDLEIDKAVMFLKEKEFAQAIESLKAFEKKDSRVACTAATNLSFLYLLENDLTQAEKYASQALKVDRYNSLALVNKGNVLYHNGDYDRAKDFFKEAVQNDSSCVEGLFNLGLCNKKLQRMEDALDNFYKLNTILRGSAQVLFHIADICDQMDNIPQATEWFLQLVSLVPNDPGILQRIGQLYEAEGDQGQAYQYYFDSYRFLPSNMEVIEWLAKHFVDVNAFDKAIQYFERAAVVQFAFGLTIPGEPKWQLMVASCHRRAGAYQEALETYKLTHRRFPDNIDCLKYLVRICTDLGMKEVAEYSNRLKKVQKAKELRDQRIASGRGGRELSAGGSGGDNSRAASGDANARRGARGSQNSAGKRQIDLSDTSGPFEMSEKPNIDVAYSDPLGPSMDRPKTAARKRNDDQITDEWADEDNDDDLLPD